MNRRIAIAGSLASTMSIAGLLLAPHAHAQIRENPRTAPTAQSAENATRQVDWTNELRAEVSKLNLQVSQLKEQNEQLSQKVANLESMTTKTAFRVTVIEPQTVKLSNDMSKLTSDFQNHTHSLSNGGVVNGNAVPWGNQTAMAGYYFVISSSHGPGLSKPIVISGSP